MSATPPPTYSNYPRSGYGPAPENRPPGVYFDSFSVAYRFLTSNASLYALATLALFGIMFLVSIPFSLLGNYLAYGSLINEPGSNQPFEVKGLLIQQLTGMIPNTVLYMLMAGVMGMAVKQARGIQPGMGDIFAGFSKFGKLFAAVLLAQAAYLILMIPAAGAMVYAAAQGEGWSRVFPVVLGAGLILFVISLFIFGPLTLYPVVVLITELSPTEALKETFRRVGRQAPLLSLLFLLAALVAGMGALACCVGLLFTFPLYLIIAGLHAHYFFPAELAAAGVMNQVSERPPQ